MCVQIHFEVWVVSRRYDGYDYVTIMFAFAKAFVWGPSVSRNAWNVFRVLPWLPTRWHWRWCEAPLERIAMLADFWKVIESLIVRSIHPQPKNRISRLRFMVELLQTCLSKWKPHRNMNRQNKFEDAFFLGWTHQRVPDKQKQIKTLTQPFLQCLGIPWETWGDFSLVSSPDPDRRAQKRWRICFWQWMVSSVT